MEDRTTATAYCDWNEQWKSDEGRNKWLVPEPEVKETAHLLRKTGASLAVDLGCGVGRHSLLLASLGFSVVALDGSDAGIAYASLQAMQHKVDFLIGLMTDLPLRENSFDYLLAWNVIYHGNRTIVARTIEEIRRVLKHGGVFQGTMLSKGNRFYGKGREIAPDTFVLENPPDHLPEKGAESHDKTHPHFYCDASELKALFTGFDIVRLADCEHDGPGTNHWHFEARKI
jgi:SAM-dependent methyltransferase